ncbi:hypothetical protein ISCGN_009882 [Ixodes scapularis]
MLRRFLRMTRLAGCCFVEGLFASTEAGPKLTARRLSPYLLYFLFGLGVSWYHSFKSVIKNGSKATLDGDIYVALSAGFFLATNVTAISMVLHAPKLVELIQMCDAFELRRPLRQRRQLNRLCTWIVLLLCAFTLHQNAFRLQRIVKTATALHFVRRLFTLLGVLFQLAWTHISPAGVFLMSRLLNAYAEEAHAALELIVSGGKSGGPLRFKFLSDTKDDLRQLRRIVEATNDVFQKGLLAEFAKAGVCLCCAIFYLMSRNNPVTVAVHHALFVTFIALNLALTTWSADGVVNQVEEIKQSVRMHLESGAVPRPLRKEIQTFVLSLDSEDYRITAGGLFKLKLSVLPSVAGAVFTYTLILIQTSLHFEYGCLVKRNLMNGSAPKDTGHVLKSVF